MQRNMTKIAAGAAAVIAIGVGAAAVGSASSGSESQAAGNRFAAPPSASGQQGGAPGFGNEATGANADKAKKAALARYPGRVERVMALPDGGYVVHVITQDGNGEVHVLLDENFNVKGTQQGGPPQGGMPPGGGQPGAPPSGGQPPSGSAPPSGGSGSGSGSSGSGSSETS
jgi:hypothetical protein